MYFPFLLLVTTWRLVLRAQIRFLFYNKEIDKFFSSAGSRSGLQHTEILSHVSGKKLFLYAFVDTRIFLRT